MVIYVGLEVPGVPRINGDFCGFGRSGGVPRMNFAGLEGPMTLVIGPKIFSIFDFFLAEQKNILVSK